MLLKQDLCRCSGYSAIPQRKLGEGNAVQIPIPTSRLPTVGQGFLFTGKLATGQPSARAEGLTDHSTGDLYGLVASAHQPG